MLQSKWKPYSKFILETIVSFYVATFCVAYFFSHGGIHQVVLASVLVGLYLFVVGVTIYRIVKKLPIQSLMLAVPIVPLLVLIILVTMIPILERI